MAQRHLEKLGSIHTDDVLIEQKQPETTDQDHVMDRVNETSELSTSPMTFDGDSDKHDPKNWRGGYKWLLVFLMSGITLTSNLTVLICAPAIPAILTEFGQDLDSPDGTLVISMWNLGATVGCLIIGPLSEVFGRLPVYHTANVLFLLTLAAQSQSVNMPMALAFRGLNGMTLGANLNASIVGDLFRVEERGKAQSLLSLMPLLGPLIGPIAGGWISEVKGWRWTFWFSFFVFAFWTVAFALCYRETYDVQILRRKSRKMGRETGGKGNQVSLTTLLRAILRPIRALTVPVFLLLTVPGCIVEGYTYLLAANITTVYETEYNFSPKAAGLVFIGISIGTIASALFCSFFIDWYTKRMKARHNGEIKPEWRLPPMVLGFISSPIGLFLYGWTVQAHTQFVVPIVGTALCGFATFIIFIPMTMYIVDTFGTHRASGTSAMNMIRHALSTVEPLAGPALYQAVGFGWGNSVLAFIAIGVAPVPIMLLWFGERIRKRSNLEAWG